MAVSKTAGWGFDSLLACQIIENMKSTDQESSGLKDITVYLAILALTGVAFYVFYFMNYSAPIQVLMWIVWLFVTMGLGYLTTRGKQIVTFAREAKVELLKVVWPSRQETIQTTTIVMIMVAVTGFVLWGIDSGMMWIIGKLTHLG